MKTLYISDLDGTLLDSNKKLSDYTINTINNLIAKGMHFSVATARTSETVPTLLRGLNINTPVILMNGAVVYDLNQKKNLKVEHISKEDLTQATKILKNHNQTGFIYTISDNFLNTFYENLENEHAFSFYNERVQNYNKVFTKVDNFSGIDNAVYFSIFKEKEQLMPLYDELKKIKGLDLVYYRDVYSKDLWFIEFFSHKASKYNALKYIKETYNYDKVICFGDNLNDLSMFKLSDECYAVANARDEVKQQATAVIDSNDNNGVAKFLEKRHL